MIGKRCEGRRVPRATSRCSGAPKPACAAACDPARLPSASAIEVVHAVHAARRETPGGKSLGTNCCSSSRESRACRPPAETAGWPPPIRRSSIRRRSRCAAALKSMRPAASSGATSRPRPCRRRRRWPRRAHAANRMPSAAQAAAAGSLLRGRAANRRWRQWHALRVQFETGRVRLEIGGHHDHPTAGSDAIARQQPRSAGRQHHAGQIVVAKHRRLLDDAGGEHHGLGAHLGHALRLRERHPMIGVVAGRDRGGNT
jgi:hypothetical protein